MQLEVGVRNAVLDSIDTSVNGGTAPELRFYVTGGATPATLAATVSVDDTAVFQAASAGSMALTAGTYEDTNATGNASPVTAAALYQNAADAAGAWKLQFGIGTTGSPDITMSNNTIANGDTVSLTALTITCPAGSNVTS